MNVSGPTPVIVLQRTDDTSLALRLNQRLSAEVLQVAGERVYLSVSGVRIVAQLTSLDQAAALAERRIAQFIVRDVDGPIIRLQHIRTPVEAEAVANQRGIADMAPELLRNAGATVDVPNLEIALALLKQGVPVELETVNAMREALEQAYLLVREQSGKPEGNNTFETWVQGQAQVLARLKSAGQPISAEILNLMTVNQGNLDDGIKRLRRSLANLSNGPQPALEAAIRDVLSALDELPVLLAADPQELAAELCKTAVGLGTPLENSLIQSLFQGSEANQIFSANPFLAALMRLRQEAARENLQDIVEVIDRFMDLLRSQQLPNLKPTEPSLKEQWFYLDFPVRFDPDEPETMAHLRAAYQEQQTVQLDPQNTRLILQVELEPARQVEVDISIIERRVGAIITVPDAQLLDRAENELPALRTGLESLGFSLQYAHCEEKLPGQSNLDRALQAEQASRFNLKA